MNTRPPVLHVSGSLQVPLGAVAPLPPTLLQAKDPDSPPERFTFHLVQGPSNGQLLLFGGEEGDESRDGGVRGWELRVGDTFTWAQLRTGRVRFRHQKDKAR